MADRSAGHVALLVGLFCVSAGAGFLVVRRSGAHGPGQVPRRLVASTAKAVRPRTAMAATPAARARPAHGPTPKALPAATPVPPARPTPPSPAPSPAPDYTAEDATPPPRLPRKLAEPLWRALYQTNLRSCFDAANRRAGVDVGVRFSFARDGSGKVSATGQVLSVLDAKGKPVPAARACLARMLAAPVPLGSYDGDLPPSVTEPVDLPPIGLLSVTWTIPGDCDGAGVRMVHVAAASAPLGYRMNETVECSAKGADLPQLSPGPYRVSITATGDDGTHYAGSASTSVKADVANDLPVPLDRVATP